MHHLAELGNRNSPLTPQRAHLDVFQLLHPQQRRRVDQPPRREAPDAWRSLVDGALQPFLCSALADEALAGCEPSALFERAAIRRAGGSHHKIQHLLRRQRASVPVRRVQLRAVLLAIGAAARHPDARLGCYVRHSSRRVARAPKASMMKNNI